jgi:hypothetical protein
MGLITRLKEASTFPTRDLFVNSHLEQSGDNSAVNPPYPNLFPGGYNNHSAHHLATKDRSSGLGACSTVKAANVISTSYSYNEADLSQRYTLASMRRVWKAWAHGCDGSLFLRRFWCGRQLSKSQWHIILMIDARSLVSRVFVL